jgi:hypothetical protein
MLIISALLILSSLIAAAVAWRGEGSAIAMREAETLSVAEVAAQHRLGRFGRAVEVVGTVECDSPLRAPYSEALCVAYDYAVSEDKERLGYGASFGVNHQHSLVDRKGERLLAHNFDQHDSRVPRLYVRDATGRIAVDTAGAQIDLLETLARYESYTGAEANVERQIWRQERALPLGNRVYVLAYLATEGGEPLLMRHPADRGRRFIISHRDEQTLLRSTRLRAYGLYLYSGLALGAALLLAAFALF